mgnify:CR=1 FL=1
MNSILLIYLLGLIFNILFAVGYWYRYRRVLKVNYLGVVLFVLASWVIYPVIVLRESLGR